MINFWPDIKYFRPSEFAMKGNEALGFAPLPDSGHKMDMAFVKKIDMLREVCGFPLIINSGYRTPEYNAAISTTGLTGAHTTGKACDIGISGEKAHILLENAFRIGFMGIGIKQKGDIRSRFIHLDDARTIKTVWSY